MTYSTLISSLKAPFPNTITRGVMTSIYKFSIEGHNSVHAGLYALMAIPLRGLAWRILRRELAIHSY